MKSMAKKHISVTNERVLKALEDSKNASRFIEEAILFYLDSIRNEYVTAEQVKAIVLDCITKNQVIISNPNYQEPFRKDIEDILKL